MLHIPSTYFSGLRLLFIIDSTDCIRYIYIVLHSDSTRDTYLASTHLHFIVPDGRYPVNHLNYRIDLQMRLSHAARCRSTQISLSASENLLRHVVRFIQLTTFLEHASESFLSQYDPCSDERELFCSSARSQPYQDGSLHSGSSMYVFMNIECITDASRWNRPFLHTAHIVSHYYISFNVRRGDLALI